LVNEISVAGIIIPD